MVMRSCTAFALALGSCISFSSATPKPEPLHEKEEQQDSKAFEIGGNLTVDGSNSFKNVGGTSARLGHFEVSSDMKFMENLEGTLTVKSENDPENITLNEALGDYTYKETEIIFGQQEFKHGLIVGWDPGNRNISEP